MISDFFTGLYQYILFSIDDVMARSPLAIFFLFAPALSFDVLRYYVTNTIIFFMDFFKREDTGEVEYFPRVSVILPVYKEGWDLKLTLDSLLESNYPNFEVLAVDEVSSGITTGVCKSYVGHKNFKYLPKARRGGKPESLNYGAQLSSGKILMHVDGDVIVERNCIREAVKPFMDPKVGGVSGNLKVRNDFKNILTILQAAEYGMCISVGRRWAAFTDTLQIASGALSFFRKEVVADLKGADPEYGEDLDITLKTRKLGFKIAFAPKAVARTTAPETLKGLFRQRVRWDRAYVRLFVRKHRDIFDFRVFKIGNFIAGLQDLVFNFILLLVFPVYIALVLILAPQIFPFLCIITYLFYAIMNFGQFIIVALLSERPGRDSIFILVSPLFFLYSLFLSAARAFAYILEFSGSEFMKDGYFPKNVMREIPERW